MEAIRGIFNYQFSRTKVFDIAIIVYTIYYVLGKH